MLKCSNILGPYCGFQSLQTLNEIALIYMGPFSSPCRYGSLALCTRQWINGFLKTCRLCQSTWRSVLSIRRRFEVNLSHYPAWQISRREEENSRL